MRLLLIVHILLLSGFSFSVHASTHHPQDFLTQIKGSKDEGMQIYTHFCSTCHASKPLIALGAPRFREESDWDARLKQDIKVLFKHTEEGINAMPPRGGCFECTNEQLVLSIVEMVPLKSKTSIENVLEVHKKNTK